MLEIAAAVPACGRMAKTPENPMRPLLPSLALVVALVAGLAASPAAALSMTSAQVGTVFCIARLSGDMAPVLAILTPELAELVRRHLPEGADAATAIPWQSTPDYTNTCEPVGASGTRDEPVTIISFGFRDPAKAGYADSLVMHFLDQRLRIDDIRFGSGTETLRQRLEAMP
jgi:hypothetical protein